MNNFEYKVLKIITYICCFASVLLAIHANDTTGGSNIRIPLRGNALDIHFINLCGSSVIISPSYFDNSKDRIPNINNRNLLFIPNTGSNRDLQSLPISITIPPAKFVNTPKGKKIMGSKFIQSMIIYNNFMTTDEDCWQVNLPPLKKTLKNYGYNIDNNSATYSSFMWTNGTRTRDDGMYSFNKAMNELKELKYNIQVKLADGRTLEFNLDFDAISDLLESEKIITHKPGFLSFSDDTAVLLYTMGGIAAFSAGPWVGAIYLLGDVAWGIAAIGTTIEDDKSYTKFTLKNRNYSWLSSPFDLIIRIKDYAIKNYKGKVIDTPEYNILNSRLDYFLGTDSTPNNIIVQVSASTKGDLHIYIVSGTIFDVKNINELSTDNQFN